MTAVCGCAGIGRLASLSHDRRNHVLRHVGIVSEKLLCVLGEAVAAISERRVVVVGADTRVESYTLDYCL